MDAPTADRITPWDPAKFINRCSGQFASFTKPWMSQLSSRNPHHETSSAKGQPEQDSSLQRGNGNEIRSFEELSEESQAGLFREFFDFLCFNKKWWLTPIILALLLVGVMIFLTTTGAAPFLYTFW